MRSRLRPRAWSKSNSSRDLRAGNRAARMRPSPPWDSRAATSRCRQAARNSSWVQDSARARSASRATDSRRVGAFSARVRNASSARHVPLAAAFAAAAITPPRRQCRARCRSRPAPASRPAGSAAGARPRAGPGACARAAARCVRVGDGLVFRPGPLMAGDQMPVAEHPHPGQVSGHLDAPADHRRVHGVVVGVQPHVVVAGQPRRVPPPGHRRHRRQGQHRRLVGVDPVRGPAPQRAMVAGVRRGQPRLELGVEVRQARRRPGRAGTTAPGSRAAARPGPWLPGRPGGR